MQGLILLILLIGIPTCCTIGIKNCSTEIRCESYRKQGAQAYVGKGILMKECLVFDQGVPGKRAE